MAWLLALVPLPPLVAFAILSLGGRLLSRRAVAGIACGTLAVSAASATALTARVARGHALALSGWRWLDIGRFRVAFDLRFDALSAMMSLSVAWVSLIILVYAAEHMAGDDGYGRFFAQVSLFVAAMLVLVTADDLWLLYLGWEGVGVCSFLLIGYWRDEERTVAAARKAFVVTRLGDAAMTVGILWLALRAGTTSLSQLPAHREALAAAATPIALLLFAGAVGKSAQVPLQVWLPDAMVGPTPVSALIHAATMVTAGVYLLCRLHWLLALAPPVMDLCAIVGAITLLVGGCAACSQRELKAVLAYSTISQLGTMFLAVGVGAYAAAIFHVATHALFKALLFLCAGVAIHALDGEQRLDRMGGLARLLPLTCACMVAGAASLAALPLVTAGFYSKDAILWHALNARGGAALFACGLVGSGLTGWYAFRAVLLTFAGPPRQAVAERPRWPEKSAMVLLAAGALFAGLVELPRWLGSVRLASRWLARSLPAPAAHLGRGAEIAAAAASALLAFIGVGLAWLRFHEGPEAVRAPETVVTRAFGSGLGFDALYRAAIVRPLTALAARSVADRVDLPFAAASAGVRALHRGLSFSQSGRLRSYLTAFALGAIALLLIALL